jgi:hypothetical protein
MIEWPSPPIKRVAAGRHGWVRDAYSAAFANAGGTAAQWDQLKLLATALAIADRRHYGPEQLRALLWRMVEEARRALKAGTLDQLAAEWGADIHSAKSEED